MRTSSRNLQFELDTGRIAALHNGLPDDRPETVLLVPGFTGSKEDFTPLLRPLATAGYRAVAIDQRGQYQSQWADSAAGYQLEALAGDLIELAGRLGGPVHLVGHSFGGLVSRLAMMRAPDRFTDLVLLGSGPAAIQGGRRERLKLGAEVLAARGMAALWDELQSQAHADPRYVRLAPMLNAFLRERFLATDPVSLRVMGEALAAEPDRCAELALLGKRILVAHGVDDDAWPGPVQAEMANRLAAHYRVIEAAAHSPAVENPPATAAALVEFWQSE